MTTRSSALIMASALTRTQLVFSPLTKHTSQCLSLRVYHEYKEKDLKRIQYSSNFLAHLFHVRPSSAIFRRRHRQFGATASSQEPERLTSILVISMSPTMTKFGLPDETLSAKTEEFDHAVHAH